MKNRIRELREQLNMTQQELAEKTLVSRQTINSLERGRYNPSAILAYRIARVFGRTIEEIFAFEEEVQ